MDAAADQLLWRDVIEVYSHRGKRVFAVLTGRHQIIHETHVFTSRFALYHFFVYFFNRGHGGFVRYDTTAR
jgi:hypothetical protein